MTERTLAIIKPDAVERHLVGQILARIEGAGFTIRAMRLAHLTRAEAEGFYAVHRGATLRGNCPIRTRPPLERVFNKLSHRDLEILTEEVPSH